MDERSDLEGLAKREAGEPQKQEMPKYLLQLYSYGGVEEFTVDSILQTMSSGLFGYSRISGDALISRSRCRASTEYFDKFGPGTAVVMVDHDMQWHPDDAAHIAQLAIDKQAVVGGLYCKRAEGRGFASRLKDGGEIKLGTPGLLEAEYVSTGFTAVPWECFEAIVENDPLGDMEYVCDGIGEEGELSYWTFFHCRVTDHTILEGKKEYLSEDWSFCQRAKAAGFDLFISTYPRLIHYGTKGFTPADGMPKNVK